MRISVFYLLNLGDVCACNEVLLSPGEDHGLDFIVSKSGDQGVSHFLHKWLRKLVDRWIV